MSFKLYDFDKEIIPEELDEQIRLICDILYNKREEYPQQLIPPAYASGLPRLTPAVSPFITNSGTGTPNQGGTSYDTYGGISPILDGGAPVASSPIETPEGRKAKHSTTTTINSVAGVRFQVNSAASNWIIAERNPYMEWWIKMSTDLLNHTIALGSVQGTQLLVNQYAAAMSVGTYLIGFIYDTAIHATNWIIRIKRRLNGAGSDVTTDINTGVPAVANRNYIFKLKLNMAVLDAVNFNSTYNISWSIEQFDFSNALAMSNYLLTQGLIINEQLPDHDVSASNRTHSGTAHIKNIVGGAGTNRSWYIGYYYQELELPGVR